MPQRAPRQAKPRGYDPTVSIATASAAKTLNAPQDEKQNIQNQGQKANDDLKKLIETLKSKIGANANTPQQKKVPPPPAPKSIWNRSITERKTWTPKPAYTILTRVSNHETVPTKTNKLQDLTVNALPHSFLYRPGADGIKVDKLSIKAGRQLGYL